MSNPDNKHSRFLYGGVGLLVAACIAIVGFVLLIPSDTQSPTESPSPTPSNSQVSEYVASDELSDETVVATSYRVTVSNPDVWVERLVEIFDVKGDEVNRTKGDEFLVEVGIPVEENVQSGSVVDEKFPRLIVYGLDSTGYYTWDYYNPKAIVVDAQPSSESVMKAEVAKFLNQLGYPSSDVRLFLSQDSVRALVLLNGEETPFFFSFSFSKNTLVSASGWTVAFESLGKSSILSPRDAVARVGSVEWMGFPSLNAFQQIYGGSPTTIDGALITFMEQDDKIVTRSELIWIMAKLENDEVRMVRGYMFGNSLRFFTNVIAVDSEVLQP